VRCWFPALLAAGCTGGGGADDIASTEPAGDGLGVDVLDAPFATGEGFGDPELAVNGVRGAGTSAGSTDVYSISHDPDDHLVLGFGGARLLDGEGIDLVVFENAFDITSGGRFMDPAVVEVSPDGERWTAFPHGFDGTELTDADAWWGFAGLQPVEVHDDERPMDHDDPAAGGDRFDLADLDGDDPVAREVWSDGAVAVRISSAASWTDPATGEGFQPQPTANGPDIDGVYAAWLRPAD